MTTLPPAAVYRKLALELRATARAKTERYAQNRLFRAAGDYGRLASQIERARALDRAPASPEAEPP
jgi:hypothetical protein